LYKKLDSNLVHIFMRIPYLSIWYSLLLWTLEAWIRCACMRPVLHSSRLRTITWSVTILALNGSGSLQLRILTMRETPCRAWSVITVSSCRVRITRMSVPATREISWTCEGGSRNGRYVPGDSRW
jgi:hypothetical protein